MSKLINESKETTVITENQINKIALETIAANMPDFEYGTNYEKEAALSFMYTVNGILNMTSAVIRKIRE